VHGFRREWQRHRHAHLNGTVVVKHQLIRNRPTGLLRDDDIHRRHRPYGLAAVCWTHRGPQLLCVASTLLIGGVVNLALVALLTYCGYLLY